MKTQTRHASVRAARSIARDTHALTTGAAPAPKRRGRRPNAPAADTAADTEPVKLSAKVVRLVEGVRAPFKAFISTLSAFTLSRAELAPLFGKAFTTFREETELTLADFTRLLDATVPQDRKGYRDHKAYQTADNLMRLYRQQNRAKVAPGDVVKRATPMDGMARLIASVLPLIGADQVTKLWETIERELHWTDRQRAALENRVKEANPLLNVRPPRGAGGAIPQLRIATSRRTEADTEQEEARTGTHG